MKACSGLAGQVNDCSFELGLLVGCGDCAEADRWEVTLDRNSVRQEGPARHTSVHWATHCETGA